MEIDRFRQIIIKTCSYADGTLFLRSAAGHGNCFQRLQLFRCARQLKPVAVGQVEIGDQDFKAHLLQANPRFADVFGRDCLAAAPVQKRAEHDTGIVVIFNQENPHGETF